MKMRVVYVGMSILRCLKEELTWAMDRWLWTTSNKLLGKTIIHITRELK